VVEIRILFAYDSSRNRDRSNQVPAAISKEVLGIHNGFTG